MNVIGARGGCTDFADVAFGEVLFGVVAGVVFGNVPYCCSVVVRTRVGRAVRGGGIDCDCSEEEGEETDNRDGVDHGCLGVIEVGIVGVRMRK